MTREEEIRDVMYMLVDATPNPETLTIKDLAKAANLKKNQIAFYPDIIEDFKIETTPGANIMTQEFLTPRQAAHELMVTTVTLRNWAMKGYVKYITLPSGHRRYDKKSVGELSKKHGTYE